MQFIVIERESIYPKKYVVLLVINDYLINIFILISGFGSDLFVGIASGTAGTIMIPCLTIFIGYSVHSVFGTSLLIDCVIGGGAGLILPRNGNVDFKLVIVLVFFLLCFYTVFLIVHMLVLFYTNL